MRRRTALLVAAAAIVSGCAAPNIDKTYALDAKRGTGVAAGTITYTGPYALYRLVVRSKATQEVYRIEHGEGTTLNIARAFSGERPHKLLHATGSPFAIELPAGEYAIEGWQLHCGAAHIASTAPVDIPFTVEPGKAIYLGNFHFRETAHVVRLITAASLTLQDKAERDLPALAAEFPVLASNPLSQALETGTRIDKVGGDSDGRVEIPIFVPIRR
jgi:hypothetical protein